MTFVNAMVFGVLLDNILFQRRVIEQGIGINTDKNLNPKLQSAVFQQLGPQIFYISGDHLFEYRIEMKSHHLSFLLSITVEKHVDMRLKTLGKKFTEMVVHRNISCIGHELTKTIIFRNQ